MSTFTYLAQQTSLFFLISHYQIQKVIPCGYYDFLFKCRKYRSKQQILLKDKSNKWNS